MDELLQTYLNMPYDEIPDHILRMARTAGRKVVAIGGGTGLSTLLLGLKEYTENIPPKNKVKETLIELKRRGNGLNVLTASPHSVLDPCLKRLGIFDLFNNV